MYELRASELGRCTKASAACLLGYSPLPTPEKMEAAYERGNVHEEECAAAMRADGWVIVDEQFGVLLDGDLWELTGHIDGFVMAEYPVNLPKQQSVWEAKAPAAWAKFRDAYLRNDWSDPLAHRYAWQISVYMIATGLEALVCCLEDGTVKTFGIEVPPFDLVQIEQRVGEIIGFVEGGLPGSCSQRDWPCPVGYLHMDEDVEITQVEDLAVIGASEEYARLGSVASEAKKAQKRVRPTLDKAFTALGKYQAGTALATVYEHTERGWDTEAMIRDGINPEKYRTVEKSTRLKVTKGSDEPEATSGD